MTDAIEVVNFDDADEFLVYLRLTNDRWWSDDAPASESDWVFRGGRDSTRNLVPSGLRPLNREKGPQDWPRLHDRVREAYRQHVVDRNGMDPDQMVPRELWFGAILEAVASFVNDAHDMGKRVERMTGPAAVRFDFRMGIEPQLQARRSEAAYALHHGIPTNLLDWTMTPEFAAFFACERWRERDPTNVVVWAFSQSRWRDELADHEERGMAIDEQHRALNQAFGRELVSPMKSDNDYLRAQKGVFTAITSEYSDEVGRWLGADEIVERVGVNRQFLKKYVLSAAAVPRLKLLIARLDISRATLMPTSDNIALTAKSRW